MLRLVVVISVFSSLAQAGEVTLLRAGVQSSAPVVKSGWVGLWPSRFVSVKVQRAKVRHPIDDDDKPASVKTGMELTLAGESELPLVLVKGLAARAVSEVMKPGPLSEAGVPLKSERATLETQRVGERGHRLVLRVGEKTQTLFEQADGDLDGWSLHWAGDLDGDGQPDFLISADTHYAVETLRLFLSSRARKNELVHEVAKVASGGC